MWKAVGIETGTVYAEAEHKSEVKRILNDGYANSVAREDAKRFGRKTIKVDYVLPETMKIIQEGEQLVSPKEEFENRIAELRERLALNEITAKEIKERVYYPWTAEEDEMLIRMYKLGYPYKEIAEAVNESFDKKRTLSSVSSRFKDMRKKGLLNVRGARPEKYGM